MLSTQERWKVAGAWGLIVACGMTGLIGLRRSSAPSAPPARVGRAPHPPPPTPGRDLAQESLIRWQTGVAPVRVPVTPYVGCIIPSIILVEKPDPPPVEFVLPTPVYSGKVELDRTLLTWSLREPKEESRLKRAVPRAIVIHRTCDSGEVERIAVLSPKATSFEDREVRPNRSYRYWVLVRGEEGTKEHRIDHVRLVDREGEGAVEGAVPSWHKVRLIGGDKEHAILGVDSYNPGKGRWESRIVRASPGWAIGETGWTLGRIRFEKFTLHADVTDDLRETRELSTRKE
ncbi:MAG TPA: hypothetical protein VJB14_17985 [Planctomycetota bacterium]|nr:hypothetical protein [Planctomycetota bacterium]